MTTAADGKSYQVGHYSLAAVLAVGYRVRSLRCTQFRRWATERLGEYLLKGFTMDDERLKNPPVVRRGDRAAQPAGYRHRDIHADIRADTSLAHLPCVDLTRAEPAFWLALGEAASKCEHLSRVPLRPATARQLHALYLAKGVAATAIEGNTLSERL